MKLKITLLVLFFSIYRMGYSQLDSIFDQGVYRTYIVHLPAGYSPLVQHPLVINMHGLSSNATEQQAYSQFDKVADTLGFVVVYPNGISNAWDIFNNTDVTFLSNLVDTLKSDFAINNCLFSTGMSMGGFMSYQLACGLPGRLNALAVVTGNMTTNMQANCIPATGIPVMHFHGTADPTVNYNGGLGLAPVDTTIRFWVKANQCQTTPIVTQLPNTNTSDSCTVEKEYYGGGRDGSEVTFYRIHNGGHTWPDGLINLPPQYGYTNRDINASSLIGHFFNRYCDLPTGITGTGSGTGSGNTLSVYPNPASDIATITLPAGMQHGEIALYNSLGQQVLKEALTGAGTCTIRTANLPAGIYTIQVTGNNKAGFTTKIWVQNAY